MSIEPTFLRAEPHERVGAVIQRDAAAIIERWARRAREDQPNARRVHHEALLDHLPLFLWELGLSLAGREESPDRHARPARQHGYQRWDVGWSLAEVVRDYQLLRLVLVDYLEEALGRPLKSREVMALGLALDDAISAGVQAYAELQGAAARSAGGAGQEAARAESAAEDFLAVLGHELRNPLAPLHNVLHLLPQVATDPKMLEWTSGLMRRQLGLLARLVDDLLDVSRVGRGKVTLARQQLDLAALVRDAAEDRRAAFAESGVALEVELPERAVWVNGDPARLAQVVGNLLANAQKFTDRGGAVTVRVTQDEPPGRATVSVRDTGIGIDDHVLERVFEAYAQADRSVGRSRGGLGLGLALVKGFVELHGGQVEATSDGPGTGALFTFWLPAAAAAAVAGNPDERPAAGAATAVKGRRVLVIEDNADAAASLKVLLELAGHSVETAGNGPDGLAAAARTAPDAILCDLGLPGMSGYAVCQALRADPATAGAAIVALSGHASASDHERSLDAGFNHHLAKPVEPADLIALIGELPDRPA